MAEDNLELKRKLIRMQRKLLAEKTKIEAKSMGSEAEDPEVIVRRVLHDRGGEVLEAAKQQFPGEISQVVMELARMVKSGEISEIGGPWLYSLLNQIGIPVRLRTTIQIISDGKAGSIADKMKEK